MDRRGSRHGVADDEGRPEKLGGLLVAIALVTPMLIFLSSGYRLNPQTLLLIGIGISLVAGVSVFGLENRGRTHRFLTHHGARPGLVWIVKLAIWSVGLAAIWGLLAIMAFLPSWNTPTTTIDVRSIDHWLVLIFMVTFYPSIGLLCGMAIRRGITSFCHCDGDRARADDLSVLADVGEHASDAGAAGHSSRAPDRFVDMER